MGAVLELPTFDLTSEPPSFEVWAVAETSEAHPLGFPLQRTSVDAKIANGVAHARVSQIYHNSGSDCLQSRYIFPLPNRAAISAMSMIIGNRTVTGEIRTRSQARQEFEEARDAGQSASLLDQERPNVFSMELANILPGDTVQVVVEYVETLSPIDGVFAFTFPTVVGPRYGEGWAPGVDTSNLTADVRVTIEPSCLGVDSDLEMSVSNSSQATQATLTGMTADIIVKFWFTEEAVGAQFLLSESGSERYFSLAIQPPQRQLLDPQHISTREYLFILDTSGSMTGYPIELSKDLMSKLLRENVRAGDSLNIMCFAGGSAVLSESGNVEATPTNIDYAHSWLDQHMQAGGGTELLPALRRAFGLPRFQPSVARTIVIMTDGYVTVEREAFDLVRDNLGDGNVFVFGIGTSVNRYLIEGLARVGYGEPFVVTDQEEGTAMVERLQRYIDTPVLTQLSLTFEGAFEPKEQEPPHLPDVFASRTIQVVGKWEGELSGQVRLQGSLADGSLWEHRVDLADVEVAEVPAVRLLWARSRIAVLSDYASLGEMSEGEVTELGLNFSLMTEYTSFVAVDSDPAGPETCGLQGNNATGEYEFAGDHGYGDWMSGATSGEMSSATPPNLLLLSFKATLLICVASFAPH
jgi:Ca-activated chloride channel family protein